MDVTSARCFTICPAIHADILHAHTYIHTHAHAHATRNTQHATHTPAHAHTNNNDAGYHLGQFCFGADKRQPYEADIRVPMAVMGPGIKAGYVDQSIALNIDLMPTFTELAGGTPDPEVDGGSLVPLLLKGPCVATRRHIDVVLLH